MTTLCIVDLRNVVKMPSLSELERLKAGAAAYSLARKTGYGKSTAKALRRKAIADHWPGEDPEHCARRIVLAPSHSATFRKPDDAA